MAFKFSFPSFTRKTKTANSPNASPAARRSASNWLKSKFATLKSKIPSASNVQSRIKSLPGSVRNRVVSATRKAYNLSTNALTKARMATTLRGNVAAKKNAIMAAHMKAKEAVNAARKAANEARKANGKTPAAVKEVVEGAENAAKAVENSKGPLFTGTIYTGGYIPIRSFGKRKNRKSTRKNRKNTRKNRKNRKNTRKN